MLKLLIIIMLLSGCATQKEWDYWWPPMGSGDAAAIMAIGMMNAGANYGGAQAYQPPRSPVQCFSSANLRQTTCY